MIGIETDGASPIVRRAFDARANACAFTDLDELERWFGPGAMRSMAHTLDPEPCGAYSACTLDNENATTSGDGSSKSSAPGRVSRAVKPSRDALPIGRARPKNRERRSHERITTRLQRPTRTRRTERLSARSTVDAEIHG